jgi:hypothetical protein
LQKKFSPVESTNALKPGRPYSGETSKKKPAVSIPPNAITELYK